MNIKHLVWDGYRRRWVRPSVIGDAPLCQCGCGQQVKHKRGVWAKFVLNHHSRGKFNPAWKGGIEKAPLHESAPLCQCGCGQNVKWNRKENNWRKFLQGHFARIPEMKIKLHAYKIAQGLESVGRIDIRRGRKVIKTVDGKYVHFARFIMEQKLGKKLNRNEVVHHINQDKTDDSIENLVVLTRCEHSKIHSSNIVQTSESNVKRSHTMKLVRQRMREAQL